MLFPVVKLPFNLPRVNFPPVRYESNFALFDSKGILHQYDLKTSRWKKVGKAFPQSNTNSFYYGAFNMAIKSSFFSVCNK